jgi:hypothetical protein
MLREKRELKANAAAVYQREVLSKVEPLADGDALTKAMADPRYNLDPVYTAEVHARIEAAEIAKQGTAAPVVPLPPPAPVGSPIPTVTPPAPGPQPFRSEYERRQAYADPRYATNPDYRHEVAAREAVS